jgi:regulator of sigma E protease
LLDHTVLSVQRGDQNLNITVPANIINDLSDFGIEQFISSLPRSTFKVDSVVPKSNAQLAGLVKGDSIIAINNAKIHFFDELQAQIQLNKNKPVELTVKRNNAELKLTTNVPEVGSIGFFADAPKEKTVYYGFFGSLPRGAEKAWGTFADNAKGIGKVFKGEAKFNKVVGGPVKIATLFGTTIDWVHFWSLVGFLSMVLAFTNLLPIPALDGGHVVFLLIEMIKGKPLSDKFLERAQIVGFVLLITLMVFVFGNDIVKQVMKK